MIRDRLLLQKGKRCNRGTVCIYIFLFFYNPLVISFVKYFALRLNLCGDTQTFQNFLKGNE